MQYDAAIAAIKKCCETGDGNLLALGIDAARARASVGEITDAMETVFGRYVASDRMVSGAYKSEYGDADDMSSVMAKIDVGREI